MRSRRCLIIQVLHGARKTIRSRITNNSFLKFTFHGKGNQLITHHENTPLRPTCSHPENLFHLLYECPCFQNFWKTAISWWDNKRTENVALNPTDILYGCLNQTFFQALNHYVVIAKYHIFLSWLNETSPSFEISAFYLMKRFFVNVQLLSKIRHWGNSDQTREHYVHELCQISLSQRMCHSYFF